MKYIFTLLELTCILYTDHHCICPQVKIAAIIMCILKFYSFKFVNILCLKTL
jgi:hypothetical protein